MIRECKAFDCTCEKCGYSWFSPTIPERCSRCKSRTWNESGKPQETEKMIIKEKPRAREVERPKEPEPVVIQKAEPVNGPRHAENCRCGMCQLRKKATP
jgi:hypothetical protein